MPGAGASGLPRCPRLLDHYSTEGRARQDNSMTLVLLNSDPRPVPLGGGRGEQRAQRFLVGGRELAAAATHRGAGGGEEGVEPVLLEVLAVPPRERRHVLRREAAAAGQVRSRADRGAGREQR